MSAKEFLPAKQMRLFFIIVIVATVVAVGLVLFFTLFVDDESPGGQVAYPETLEEYHEDKYSILDSMVLPDELYRPYGSVFHHYRERKDKWTEEDIDKYWVDPRKLSITILKQKSEEIVDSILQGVE